MNLSHLEHKEDKMPLTPLLENHRMQISGKASEYSRIFDLEPTEIMNQGVIIFYKSIKTHNPKLSNFNTWLYLNLQWGLYAYCKKNKTNPDFVEYIDDEFFIKSFLCHNKRQLSFSDMIINLSENSRQVVNIILNQDNQPINMKKKERLNQKTLKKYLNKVKKWNLGKVNASFLEIRVALRNI